MSAFTIVVDLDTDDPGAIHAAKAIKRLLEPVYGTTGTRTFTRSMFDSYFGLRPVVLGRPASQVPQAEHDASQVNGRRWGR